MKRLDSGITFIFLTAILIGGFSNFMPQEADAAKSPPDIFLTGWDITNSEITIPVGDATGVYQVYWNEDGRNMAGDFQTFTDEDAFHEYTSSSVVPNARITITGDFNRISLIDSPSPETLLEIIQWGDDKKWTSMNGAFAGAINLNIRATDTPDLSLVTDMRYMFADATNFNSDISNWDVSSVTDMDGMFDGADSFNQNLGNWYIALDEDTITLTNYNYDNIVVASITASNSFLDNQVDSYSLVNNYQDNNMFDIVDGTTLIIKDIEMPLKEQYTIQITADGGDIFGGVATKEFNIIIVDASEEEPETTTTSNGSGCNNCESPTLGIDSKSKRIVEDGFTYNGISTDVERFYTPYPLITVNIGTPNTAVFKIYEDTGPQNISHLGFAFGLASNEVISQSKAIIELDIEFDGTETVTITDPENALENVQVSTDIGNCNPDDSIQCLFVTIDHTFRAPLDFNIVATDVWDTKRNAWQNYYNHGIEVIGESLNPPNQYSGIDAGHIYHLTETSKNTSAVDEFGDSWSFHHDAWTKDYIKNQRVQDDASSWNVMTRMHSEFAQYKEVQAQNAVEKLLELCPTCMEDSFTDFEDSWSYDISEKNKDRIDKISYLLEIENKKALKVLANILESHSSPKFETDKDDNR